MKENKKQIHFDIFSINAYFDSFEKENSNMILNP